jgi:MULE transposase domain
VACDEHGHGMPLALIIHADKRSETLQQAIDALKRHLEKNGVTGRPRTFTTDAEDSEIKAVAGSEWGKAGTTVGLCLWHVKRAWLKNLLTRLPGEANKLLRHAIMNRLCNFACIEVRASASPPHATWCPLSFSGSGRGQADMDRSLARKECAVFGGLGGRKRKRNDALGQD